MSDIKKNDDNRSRQLNPEHGAYWKARGHAAQPGARPTETTRPLNESADKSAHEGG